MSPAAADGAPLNAVALGEVDEPTWSWEPGLPVFLGADGVLTQVAPSVPALFSLELSTAVGPTRIFFEGFVGWHERQLELG